MNDADTMIKSPIMIRLLVEPVRLSMDRLESFRIGLIATNTTNTAVDPHLFGVRLLVNGTPSPAFDLVTGNVMPVKWDNLPAGETTPPIEWPLGKALFPTPGTYNLVLRLSWENWTPVESSATVIVTS